MATVITGEATVLFQMRSQLSAIGLEITGMRFRQSVSAFVKRQYGIKKTKKVDVWKELHKLCLEKEKELGIEPRPLNRIEKKILAM